MSSIHTHLYLATYGAGLKPGRLLISSNSSSVTLKEAVTGDCSSPTTQNILAPTEKTRSCPHFTSVVTPGNALQIASMSSMFIRKGFKKCSPRVSLFVDKGPAKIYTCCLKFSPPVSKHYRNFNTRTSADMQ